MSVPVHHCPEIWLSNKPCCCLNSAVVVYDYASRPLFLEGLPFWSRIFSLILTLCLRWTGTIFCAQVVCLFGSLRILITTSPSLKVSGTFCSNALLQLLFMIFLIQVTIAVGIVDRCFSGIVQNPLLQKRQKRQTKGSTPKTPQLRQV
ncbi:hypothetical protein QBC46DRAFT_60798 [Diplogelasinospora grovesii]|uniref:Uncharacterized protein n=1 Tax=Diplogelasinospora grovesii TaxID=303347 RepID=A0AAN6NHD1_9PEZI|nr:hypothetical protein QBC46DRAFT_60798 [Diplogelasinospora grovesii]